MKRLDIEVTGGCQCGAVRYKFAEIAGSVSICHCRMCQKAHGAPVIGWVPVRNEDLVWTRGKPAVFRSSSIAARTFCAACGTPLTFRLDAEETTDIATATLDQPERLPPTRQYGIEGRMSWFSTAHTLPGEAAGIIENSHQHPDHDTDDWHPHRDAESTES